MATLAKLTEILTEQLGVSPGDIVETSNLAADLGADSLDTVEICLAVEAEFSIDIPDEKMDDLLTVGQWVAYIDEKQQAAD